MLRPAQRLPRFGMRLAQARPQGCSGMLTGMQRRGYKFESTRHSPVQVGTKTTGSKSTLNWYKEEVMRRFPRTRLLVRGEMLRQRIMFNPFIMGKEVRNLSDIAGHGAFLMLAISYTETDVFNLRMYAAAGVSLSIVFQYYRAQPLYLPIRWNFLFLLINLVMMGALLKQSIEAAGIPDEQKKLYATFFQEKGMHSVEFMQLMSIANRKEYAKGEYLAKQGGKRNKLHLIVSGRGNVVRDGEPIGVVERNQFVGEMSYLAWEANMRKRRARKKAKALKAAGEVAEGAEADESDEMDASSIASRALQGMGVSGAKSSSSTVKLTQTSVADKDVTASNAATGETESWLEPEVQSGWGAWTSTMVGYVVPGWGSANSPDAKGVAFKDPVGQGYELTDRAVETMGGSGKNYVGTASVVCIEPAVVYTFAFKDISKLVHGSDTIGTVFERCLSSDLNKKLVASINTGPEKRFRELAEHFLGKPKRTSKKEKDEPSSPSGSDAVKVVPAALTGREIALLEKYRVNNRLPDEFVSGVLKDCGWTDADYKSGYRGKPTVDSLRAYETIVRGELERLAKRHAEQVRLRSDPEAAAQSQSSWWGTGTGTDVDGGDDVIMSEARKQAFMQIRMRDEITYAQHLHIIAKAGWKGDDYERGCLHAWVNNVETDAKKKYYFRFWLN